MDGDKVFGLPEGDQGARASHQSAEKYVNTRRHFSESVTFAKLASLVARGAAVKVTQLSSEFSYQDYLSQHGTKATVLLTINPQGAVLPPGGDGSVEPKEGWDIVSFIQNAEDVVEDNA